MGRLEEDLSGVDRPGRTKKPGWQITKKEILVQGVRYLSASAQDSHPAYGIVHASYARLIFESLAHEGDYYPNLLRKAGELQEVWTQRVLEKIPLDILNSPEMKNELREILAGP